MNFNKLALIRGKLERSLHFLGLEHSEASVYLAENHWNAGVIEIAHKFHGFGILNNNGKDLDILDPSPGPVHITPLEPST